VKAGAGVAVAMAWIAALVIGTVIVSLWGPDPLAIHLNHQLVAPNLAEPLGTDELGRSLLGRLLAAALSSLIMVFSATALSIAVGAFLGLVGGWFGGWIDAVIQALISLFWSIPFAIFAILLLTVAGASVISIVLVIAGVNWVGSARVIRAETLRIRSATFVSVARARGTSNAIILLSEILPNLRATALVLLGFGAAETLSLESGLAYLGMSLPPPSPSWGGIMNEGMPYVMSAWWVAAIPALAIVLTIASFRLFANGLAARGANDREFRLL